MAAEERDRITNPSINFPQSAEEAHQAILCNLRRHLTGDSSLAKPGLLARTYTTDSGLGTTRSEEAADWLNEAQSLIGARLEDFLDSMDLEFQR